MCVRIRKILRHLVDEEKNEAEMTEVETLVPSETPEVETTEAEMGAEMTEDRTLPSIFGI